MVFVYVFHILSAIRPIEYQEAECQFEENIYILYCTFYIDVGLPVHLSINNTHPFKLHHKHNF